MKHLALLLFLAASLSAQIFSPPGAVRRYSGTPTAGDCNANATNRLSADISAIPTVYYACIQTSSGVYAWTNIAASGSGSGDVLGGFNLTTAGACVYVSASGTLNQDSPGCHWDATNNRLGLGTATPTYALHVVGSAILNTSEYHDVDSNGGRILWNSSSSSFSIGHVGGAQVFLQRAAISPSVGIGPSNTSPDSTLKVFDATATTGDTVVKIRDGAAAGARINFSPYSSTTPDAGIRHISANNLGITNGGATTYATIGAGGIQMGADNTYPIGASGSGRPSALFVAGAGTFGDFIVTQAYVGIAGGNTRLYSSASGVMELANSSHADFNRLQFGGTTNLFPSWKRSTTELQAKLADDSAFTKIRSSGVIVDGATSTNCLLADGTTGACGSGGSGTFQSTITDLKPTRSTVTNTNDTLNIAAGRCWGTAKSAATAKITAGNGTGSYVAYCTDSQAIIVEHSTSAGLSVTCTNCTAVQVATPEVDEGMVPIASGTLSSGATVSAWSDPTDTRDLHLGGIRHTNGAGMNVTCNGGVCVHAIDTAVVPTMSGSLAQTGTVDFRASTSVRPFEDRTSDPTCTSIDGRVWYRTDTKVYKGCANDAVVTLSSSGSTVAKNGVYLQIGSTNYLADGMYAITAPTTSGKSFITNAGSASATTTSTGGALKLTLTSGTSGWRPYGKARSAITKFTLAISCPGYASPGASLATVNACGMGFRDSGTGRIQGFRFEFAGSGIAYMSISNYMNATTYSANVAMGNMVLGAQLLYLQVEITGGTTAKYRYSPDGTNWTEIYSDSTFLATPDEFWVGGMADNTSGVDVLIYSWLEE